MSNAIALGCDGVTTQTKNSTDSLNVTMSFVAQKLPEMEKTITSITSGDVTKTYEPGMGVKVNDTIHYTITVYSAVLNEDYGSLTYENINVTDALTGGTWGGKGTQGTVGTYTVNGFTYEATPYTYETSLTLTDDNFGQVVKNGVITNTANMSYTYKAKYSSGSVSADAVAVADVQVDILKYVVDFGLPVTVDLTGSNGSNTGTITKVWTVGNGREDEYGKYGTVSLNGNAITYTPTRVMDGVEYVKFNYKYTNGTREFTYEMAFIPASNVLYEEGFMTAGKGWSASGTTPTAAQKAESTTKPVHAFGYDDVYAGLSGELGVWKADGLAYSTMTDALTAEFYGNTFDLIGSCGPTTGRVMLMVTNQDTEQLAHIVIVDTRFKDATYGTIYQVPLAHVELGDNANYKVEIYASGSKGSESASTASAVSTYALYDTVSDDEDGFNQILAAYGLRTEDVPCISAEALAVSGIAETDDSTAITYQPGTHVEIDSFRVYTGASSDNYPADEQNVQYVNILYLMDGQISAYREPNDLEKPDSITRTNYESLGGPQNEIYLAKGQSISFNIDGVEKVQVSLRAVSGTVQVGERIITSNTEMYYAISKTEGVFTILNTGDGLLAIGNVKVQNADTAEVTTMSMLDDETILRSVRAVYASAKPAVPDYEPFVRVDVRSINLFRSKVVTVTITTSTDVETLTVNGKTLRPTNSRLVKYGLSDHYVYVYVDTVRRGETVNYEITATNSDGLSCTCGAQG